MPKVDITKTEMEVLTKAVITRTRAPETIIKKENNFKRLVRI